MAAAAFNLAFRVPLQPCLRESIRPKVPEKGVAHFPCVVSATRADFLVRAPLADQCTSRNSLFGSSLPKSPSRGTAQPHSSQRKRAIQAMSMDAVTAAASAMETFLYPVGTQYFWNVALPISSIVGAFGAYRMETSGQNMGYSKFARESEKLQMPSKWGMFLLYFPSALVALWWLLTMGDADNLERVRLVGSLVAVHFWKRVLEVLFLHKFSGKQDVVSSIFISSTYAFNTFALLYVQNYACTNSPPPSLDLSTLGVGIFTVGVVGNLYHHWILAGLRKDKDGGYQVPQGGLFGLVTCPHYFFEIVDFLGMTLASQTFYSFGWFAFTVGYLSGRSVATKDWYLKKVDGFPKGRKNIVPFLF